MGRVRVVAPGSDRIEISDGDWIEVKRELNNGDAKKLEAVGLKPPVLTNGQVLTPIDWEIYEMERALVFITDWSLVDDKGDKLPLSRSGLSCIDAASFSEINRAIIKHTSDRAKEKNSAARTEKPKESGEISVSEPTSAS